jgi:mono/diheme cytochrome c family protein
MNPRIPLFALAAISLAGCHTDMWRQPKGEPLGENDFFPDGQMSRPLLTGTIARGKIRKDDAFFTGAVNGKWVDTLPVPLTKALLERGQERYNVYCSPCHGQIGDGNGMIANRGFTLKRPVGNYHTDRLRKMPVGHFYDVITNGYGAMYSYSSRVEPSDRWAIVAYIKALQVSQAPGAFGVSRTEIEAARQKHEAAAGADSHSGDSHSGDSHSGESHSGESHSGESHAEGAAH